ncbi:type I polyketide synthase [Streptomyces mutabilis]|uniref:type I polyketide synthase n=1 Tax=Streptomyces mutabilis TaxID=67332 RepID=UPI0006932785|nr:type I polyketide synthase [Streptomyces mutabilis]
MSVQQQSRTAEALKQSVVTIQSLRRKLEQMKQSAAEPIAVVGMACRFPGGCDTPEKYWSFLSGGGVGVRDVPEDRWPLEEYFDPNPGTPGKMYIRQSNFLARDVSSFDARFFKISPVEANAMDPQQRQLLEVCWEALENAGQRPDELRGTSTGVFVGVSSNSEYGQLVEDSDDVNQYIGTGTTSSVASGRIAYAFGWNGPAISLDTACSSSLVSTQLAVESLRRGECGMAVAGGVSMMLAPGVMASLCAMNALAPDGRSKPFDASADGYGRGEGCGLVVLKRLSDARRDKDTVYAVIRGGAVNNDGESSGLTIPNGRAQKSVLEQALKNAGLTADVVDYLETHGTGTLLGDPIEIDAVNQVYGRAHSAENKLMLGAVKGNIGHLESAAGVASLIKAALVLHHGAVPPIAGLQELNPRIQPMSQALTFPTSALSWPAKPERPRHVGVSSFGFSGTNAHMILSEAPAGTADGDGGRDLPSSLLTLTATDENKLVRQIRLFDEYLADNPDASVEDLCYTTNACRAAFPHRSVFLGSSVADLRDGFRAVLGAYEDKGTLYSDASVVLGSSHGSDRYNAKRTLFTTFGDGRTYTARTDEEIKPKLAFVLGGDPGSTFEAARSLCLQFPAFRETLTACLSLFEPAYGPQSAFEREGAAPATDQERQAWLFASQYALYRLLEGYGITPQIAFGERTGSLVAAVVTGGLSLESAVRHCVELAALHRSGAPLAFARVLLDGGQAAVDAALATAADRVHLSAVYSPSEWVLSGESAALDAVTAELRCAGADVVPESGHWPSAGYAARAGSWRQAVARETYRRPGLRYQSPHTLLTTHKSQDLQQDIAGNSLTAPIRYGEGLEALYEQGYRFFVELGSTPARATLPVLDRADVVTVRPVQDAPALDSLLRALAQVTCLGATLNWGPHYAGRGRTKLMLPNYPFEQSRHWLTKPEEESAGLQSRLAGRVSRSGLDGEALNLPVRQKQYLYTFTHGNFPELLDNSGVVHVGYFLEMLREVMRQSQGDRPLRVTGMQFFSPVMVFADEVKEVLLLLDPDDDGGMQFQFHSRNAGTANWGLNVQGRIAAVERVDHSDRVALDEVRNESDRHATGEEFYRTLEKMGFHFGPAVRWVDEVWQRPGDGLVRFTEPDRDAATRAYALGFHPGVLDSCAQTCNYVAIGHTPEGRKFMVSELDDIVLRPGAAPRELYALVEVPVYDGDRQEVVTGFRLVDGSGTPVVSVGSIRLKEFDDAKLGEIKSLVDSAALDKGGEDRDFLLRYANADAERKYEMVLERLRGLLALILEMELDEVGLDEDMRNFGLDSMTGLRFFNKTNQLLGSDISLADVVQSKDLRDMARRVVDALPGGTGELQTAHSQPYDHDLTVDHWIYARRQQPEAKVRLFCFPNGFRNADLFDDWKDELGPEIDVCPVVLPGIDSLRLEERPPADIEEFMRVLEQVITPELLDIPCATFGHSWGSLFSFRLSHRLGLNPDARLLKTFVSGFAAPSAPNPTIVKILDQVGQHGMTRIPTYEEIRHDQDMVRTVVHAYMNGWGYSEDEARATLPQLLAACSVIDRYTHDTAEKFTTPITAFYGVDDWVASEETKLWEELTSGDFTLHTMAGDHQFINKNQSEGRLLALIREELLGAVRAS